MEEGTKQVLRDLFAEASRLDNVDVHQFNREWVRPNLPTVKNIFDVCFGRAFRRWIVVNQLGSWITTTVANSNNKNSDTVQSPALLEQSSENDNNNNNNQAAASLSNPPPPEEEQEEEVEKIKFSPDAFDTFRGLIESVFRDRKTTTDRSSSSNNNTAHQRALNQLDIYFQRDDSGVTYADAETGVTDVLELLLQSWFLATTDNDEDSSSRRQFVYTLDPRTNAPISGDAVDFVLFSLQENFKTRGGCAPGFAGRCVRDLLVLLCVKAGMD